MAYYKNVQDIFIAVYDDNMFMTYYTETCFITHYFVWHVIL